MTGQGQSGIVKYRPSEWTEKTVNQTCITNMEPGEVYMDRISWVVPDQDLPGKILKNAEFSTEVSGAGKSSRSKANERRAFIPEAEIDIDELVDFVLATASPKCWKWEDGWQRKHEQYMRHLKEEESKNSASSSSKAPTRNSSTTALKNKPKSKDATRTKKDIDSDEDSESDDEEVAKKMPFVNGVRFWYRELSAPRGTVVALRGKGKTTGMCIIAEYANDPEDEIGEENWAKIERTIERKQRQGPGTGDEPEGWPYACRNVRVIGEISIDEYETALGMSAVQRCCNKNVSAEAAEKLRKIATKNAAKIAKANEKNNGNMKRRKMSMTPDTDTLSDLRQERDRHMQSTIELIEEYDDLIASCNDQQRLFDLKVKRSSVKAMLLRAQERKLYPDDFENHDSD